MLCDGSPDPTIAGEINTYMNLWRENTECNDIQTVLRDGDLTLKVSVVRLLSHLYSDVCVEHF